MPVRGSCLCAQREVWMSTSNLLESMPGDSPASPTPLEVSANPTTLARLVCVSLLGSPRKQQRLMWKTA